MTSPVKLEQRSEGYIVIFSFGSGVWVGAGPAFSTVDPADIRGLVTTLLDSVRGLPQSRHEGRPKPGRS